MTPVGFRRELPSRLWHSLWPQGPLALFMIAAGAINILTGVQTEYFLHLTTGVVPQFGEQISVGVLGSGAQIIFGAGLVFSGFGLFWRMRVAWAFAVMLLLITIAINLAKSHFGPALIIPGFVLLGLLMSRRSFRRQTLLGNSLVSLVSVFAVIAYGTFGIYLLGNQFQPPITTMLTALYFLVETLSTTGYGDYAPTTQFAQGFMVTVWVGGLGVFAAAIVSVMGPALANHLDRFFTPGGVRRMQKNHIILIGSGIFAASTARELARRGISFTQVVRQGENPPLPEQPAVFGDLSDDQVLTKAGICKARLLIAAEDDDGENAFITLAAKDLNAELKVLAVATSHRAIRRLKLARADTVFAPSEVGSRLLVDLTQGEQLPAQFLDLLKSDHS